MPLSKSRYMNGLQCEKLLWLATRQKRDQRFTRAAESNFARGREVGALARGLYPGGELIHEGPQQLHQAEQHTRAAIREGKLILYEATLSAGGVLVRVDILKRSHPKGAWQLLEVKSATDVAERSGAAKAIYVDDIAVQRWVLEQAGFKVGRCVLVHVNSEYVRSGEIDVHELFTEKNVTRDVEMRLPGVAADVERLHQVLERKAAPKQPIGPQCDTPYECPYKHLCWEGVPGYSTLDIAYLSPEKRFRLFHSGVVEIGDVTPELMREHRLQKRSKIQVRLETGDRPRFKEREIAAFLDGLEFPLFFLDLESYQLPVPPFDGARPWQQIPFQASVHVVDGEDVVEGAEAGGRSRADEGAAAGVTDGGTANAGARSGGRPSGGTSGNPRHLEFLAADDSDPRPGLARFLVDALGETGSVVAWHASFERKRLQELADLLPEHADALSRIVERLVDLELPFARRWVARREFKGRSSIKAVTPALFPGEGYDGMEIADGLTAALEFLESVKPDTPAEARETIHADLKTYCAADTLNTVRIWQWLRRGGGNGEKHLRS